jgi:hypothetical protein
LQVKYSIVSLLGNRPAYQLETLTMEQLHLKVVFAFFVFI